MTNTKQTNLRSIESLLALNAAGALVPHGLGGLAPQLLTEAKAELEALRQALELAYGLLWGGPPVNTRTADGLSLLMARQALLAHLDRDGQARGITAAKAAFAKALESRKNPRTATDDTDNPLIAMHKPYLG